MRRLLLLPLSVLLCAALPPGVTITPDPPLLGRPLTLEYALTDTEAALAGLPALGSFELLLPPQAIDGRLRLLLLPMRPGAQQLPPLPLAHGGGGEQTPALELTVLEGLPADAPLAPLLTWSAAAGDKRHFSIGIPLLLGLVAAGAMFLHFRHRRRATAPPRAATADDRLAQLQQRLTPLLETRAEARTLHERLQALRFGPASTTDEELTALSAAVALLCEAPP